VKLLVVAGELHINEYHCIAIVLLSMCNHTGTTHVHKLCYRLCYITGTDTLSGSLSWLLYELGAHQDVQQKLRDEITAVTKGVFM
jgi:Cytochrome P450